MSFAHLDCPAEKCGPLTTILTTHKLSFHSYESAPAPLFLRKHF